MSGAARPITDIDAIVAGLAKKNRHELSDALRANAASKDIADPCQLLANIFDMHLRPDNVLEPYGPMVVMDGKRSMIPSDLTPEQLALVEEVFKASKEPEIRSRLGDLLWVIKKDHAAARIAVHAFVESGAAAEDPDHWPICMERYTRAARLAMMLGRKSDERAAVAAHLLERVRLYAGSDPLYFTEKAIELLTMLREGDPAELATYAETAATKARAEGDGFRARSYYEQLEKLHRRAGNADGVLQARIAIAETWVEDADRRIAGGDNMAGHGFIEDAIRTYREIPGKEALVAALHKRLNEAGERSLDQMQKFETQVDLTAYAKEAIAGISGLSVSDAVCAFALVTPLLHPDLVREFVRELAAKAPLMHMMASVVVDQKGRKVATIPAMTSDDPAEQEEGMRLRVIKRAEDEYRLAVSASIWPALQALADEHFISEVELTPLCEQSGFVPVERREVFIRGLAAGFRSDFVSALSLLIPQVENSLRIILKQNGVITTSLNQEGVEEEWSLNRVLAEPELEKIMNPAWLLAMRAMLVEKVGPNFRNLLMHGLLDPDACHGAAGVFVWWLILRLVVVPTPQFAAFQARKKAQAAGEQQKSDTSNSPTHPAT